MIVKGQELRRHAYMVSSPADAALTTLSSGQLVMENADGKVVLCDGSARGFLSFSDKTTTKDNVTDKGGMVSYAIGPVVVTVDTDSFVTGQTYAFGTRLIANATGKLTPATEGVTAENLISAIALGSETNGTLRVAQV